MLNNNVPNIEPCGTPLKCDQNYYKNHSPLFFALMLESITNLYLPHMHLVLHLTTDDRYNQIL